MDSSLPSVGKVLVIGGCGFLGSHIVSLIAKRHPQTQISVLDLRTNANRHSSPDISYHDCDITNFAAVKEAFGKIRPDSVIHTASPHFNLKNHELFLRVNVDGTKNLVRAAQETGVKAFVYTSSASVILGKTGEIVNADETWPMVTGDDQPEFYTTTKAYGETAVLEANRTTEYPSFLTCAIRPAGIFGEGDVQNMPSIVQAYWDGRSKWQVGENNNLFDFTYVENVAYGHILALIALLHTSKIAPTIPLDSERVDGEAFFITNGQPVYFWDYARAAWHAAGDRRPLSSVWQVSAELAYGVGTIMEGVCWLTGRTPNLTRDRVRYSTFTKYHNIDKAKKRLGYVPLVSLDEGIKRGVQYILDKKKAEDAKKGQ